MNLQDKASFIITTALINSLAVTSLPVNSKLVAQNLQKLPDGIHLYSNVRLPKQPGAEYFILRKKGRNFIEYGYIYQSDSSCIAGTIRGNTLNTTRKYDSDASEKRVYETNGSINLNQYYKLSSRYISAEDIAALQSCINLMSR